MRLEWDYVEPAGVDELLISLPCISKSELASVARTVGAWVIGSRYCL